MASDFKKLFEFGKSFFAEADIEKFLPLILDVVIEYTNAERCRIVLYDDDGEALFNKGRKRDQTQTDILDTRISRKIVEIVKKKARVFVSPNAMEDERLKDPDRKIQTFVQQRLLSVACAPLCYQSKIFGVIYIDNRDASAVFSEWTAQLLEGIAYLIADALYHSMENTLKQRQEAEQLQHHLQNLRDEVDRLKGYGKILGKSPAIKKIYEIIENIKDLPINVLVTGESGTGKELVARALHRKGSRRDKPFKAIDCSAIPENMLESELFGHEKGAFTGAEKLKLGLIEEADTGTLFIDEIGNISLTAQRKLLRFLDAKTYYRLGSTKEQTADVRLIFATNKDIPKLIQEEKFLEDLYFRLKRGVSIELPPLRDRGRDILLIAEKLLLDYSEKFRKPVRRFSDEAQEALLRYHYPGNVRELDQFVANAIIWAKGDTIHPEDFPPELFENKLIQMSRGKKLIFDLEINQDKNIYNSYLPETHKENNFIFGACSDNEDREDRKQFHDKLAILINRAGNIPLSVAARAVTSAFERNFIIENLIETNGKVVETAKRIGVDKKTLIEKMKKLDIKREWYVE